MRRSVTMLVVMMGAAGAFLAGATAKAPVDHRGTSQYASVQGIAIDSVITSGASPDVYYDT
jgi:hypothetical protein